MDHTPGHLRGYVVKKTIGRYFGKKRQQYGPDVTDIKNRSKRYIACSDVVDLMGFEPTTSRMRTERARKVVSFLPRDCDVWSAKMDDHSFAGEKYFGGFSN